MQVILAIDTATRYAGLALYNGEQVLAEVTWIASGHHTEALAPTIDRLLAEQQLSPSDLAGIAVSLGPGSFTGLRIGLSLAKGLALTCDLPIVGVPTLEALAWQHRHISSPIWTVLEAGRGRICVACYRFADGMLQELTAPCVTRPQTWLEQVRPPAYCTGEIDPETIQALCQREGIEVATPAEALRRPAFVAERGWHRIAGGDVDDPVTLSPIYLHPTEG